MSQITYRKDSHVTDELGRRNTLESPDYLDLKLQDIHPVFVYGTLKSGGRLHDVLEGCPWFGDAVTASPAYDMFEVQGGSFPVVFEDDKNPAKGKVYGEVYGVSAQVLLELDRIESNRTMYTRDKKFVKLLDQRYTTKTGHCRPFLKCWMYIGNKEFWQGYDLRPMAAKIDIGQRYYEFFANRPKMLQ